MSRDRNGFRNDRDRRTGRDGESRGGFRRERGERSRDDRRRGGPDGGGRSGEDEGVDPSAPRPVAGRNAVEEALKARSRIRIVYVADGTQGADIKALVQDARRRNIKVTFTERDALRRISGSDRHQGVVALLDPFEYADAEQLVQKVAREKGYLVVVDSVQDPHNLGAIVRSAEAFGAGGLLIPKDRQAPVTLTVERAAAGATAHLPVARIGNLARMLSHLKEAGYWIVGADANEGVEPEKLDLDRPLAVLLGSEEKGIRPVNLKECHARVRIPLAGKTGSLNVSVAAGVLLYALTRKKSG